MSKRDMIEQLGPDYEPKPATGNIDLILQEVHVIRLEKVFSWQQSYNRYPYYLSRGDPDRIYTFEEVYTVLFQTAPPGPKKDGASWVRNTFGLARDPRSGQITVKGIGLLKDAPGGYRLSREAVELGNTFAEDRHNDDWLRAFASILARNDIRTRCVLYYLGRLGHAIQFPKSPTRNGFFKWNIPTWLLVGSDQTLSLFGDDPTTNPRYSFTSILRNATCQSFGPFLSKKLAALGLTVAPDLTYIGALSKGLTATEPSSANLDTYLKQTLSIFKDLGIFTYSEQRQAWSIDYERARTVMPADIVADLFTSERKDPFLSYLREVYEKLADTEGLASVRQIREWVCDLVEVPSGERVRFFNERVAHYISPGQRKLGITRQFHAQAPPEDCLFFDLEKEYVAFVFAEDES